VGQQKCVGQHCSHGAGHGKSFLSLTKIFQISNCFQFVKYEYGTYMVPKISKLRTGVDMIIVNNFSHWPNFRFPLYFML
jgi:hypothetical protein